MLRGSIASSNRLLKGSFPRRPAAQWLSGARSPHANFGQRHQRSFADTKKPDNDSILSSDPAFASSSGIKEAKIHVPPAPDSVKPPPTSDAVKLPPSSSASPATPSSQSTIPPEKVPLTPPSPAAKVQTAPPPTVSTPPPPPPAKPKTVAPPPPPPPPPPPKKPRRLRSLLVTFLVLAGFGYAGGVWYSLVDDNFHDFFTEYVPFGDQAVLYLQEQDFQRRFPNATRYSNRVAPATPRDSGSRVTIPSKSGLSWKVSEDHNPDHELQPKGRHMNATDANKVDPDKPVVKETEPPTKPTDKPAAAETKPAPPKKEIPKETPKVEASKDERPPAIKTTALIDPLKIDQADDPLVQDLVKIVNDIIIVINADNASNKYAQPIGKAKDELTKVGHRIIELKKAEQAAAEAKIKDLQSEFDKSAKELLRRIDEARMEEATSFREEFEAEREKISQSYAEKAKTELARSNEVAEQRLRNELLEQAIEMKRKFVADVKSLVENEREGRLSKLSEIQSNVSDLEKMASDWNGVIDSNLQTQQLQVAVDAVRSTLERADIPRPFVRELAALKEIANDDPVVNAAIASINPSAYQRGIPTSAQLVDRFRRVASEVRKASLLPEDAGIASHAASFVLSKVLFKKSGLAQGEDVESILTRTETLLEEGDLDGAAREMNTLGGWAKTLSRDWLGDVRRVLEVRQALEVMETEARLQCLRVE